MGSWYDRVILPRLLGCACSSPPIMRQRAKVVPRAEGRVLELGIGMGLNLGFYDPQKVTEVIGLDPAAALRDPGPGQHVCPQDAEIRRLERMGLGDAGLVGRPDVRKFALGTRW
jgi:hypothetical protein